MAGTTQTAETKTTSVKVWEVTKVDDKGDATFTHLVSSVDMFQKLTGRQEVRYNSETDETPPAVFEQAAADVGIPLSEITINNRGETVKREEKRDRPVQSSSHVTILLPEEEVAVGEEWKFPYTEKVAHNDGRVKEVKTQQRFKLLSVRDGIAKISVKTQILTPIHDPVIEAQLVQRDQGQRKVRHRRGPNHFAANGSRQTGPRCPRRRQPDALRHTVHREDPRRRAQNCQPCRGARAASRNKRAIA